MRGRRYGSLMTTTNNIEMQNTPTTLTIKFPHKVDLAFTCEVLAMGDTVLGAEAEAAGGAVIQWAGVDCPWFVSHPYAAGHPVADFVIAECA